MKSEEPEIRRARYRVAGSVGITILLSLTACGSTKAVRAGSAASDPPSSNNAAAVTTNYAAVAVASDVAVVADGSVPTKFQYADLASSEPTKLTPLSIPKQIMFLDMAKVGSRISVAGNQCGNGATNAGAEIICDPGSGILLSYNPKDKSWTEIELPGASTKFANASFAPSDSTTTVVNLMERSEAGTPAIRRLLKVDLGDFSVESIPTPSDFTETNRSETDFCASGDGHLSLILAADIEDVAGAPKTQVWTMSPTASVWTEVSVPNTGGDHEWHSSGCIAGNATIKFSDESESQRLRLNPTSGDWHDMPVNEWPASVKYGGIVDEPDAMRAWLDGKIWMMDLATGSFVDSMNPSSPLAGVRSSSAWGEKVVALVDVGGEINASHDMKLSIEIVN